MKTNNRNYSIIIWCLIWPIIAIFAGCSPGPDYKRPATIADDADSFCNLPALTAESNETGDISQWWRQYGSDNLNELVEKALGSNRDIASAGQAVNRSRAILEQAAGQRLPAIDYSANRTRGKSLAADPITGDTFQVLSTSYSQDISISYVTDIFGKLRRFERAALYDLMSSQASREALVHAIAAQTVRTAAQISTQRKLIDIAEDNINTWQETLDIARRRFNAGLVSSLDVYQSRENLAAARAAKLPLKLDLQKLSHSLDVLVARRAGAQTLFQGELGYDPNYPAVPAYLPAWLLDRRPDIKASEMKLAAATERIGYGIAQLYPDLTLTGSGGYRSEQFSTLFDADNQVYSLIMSLAAPIWRGGGLRAQVRQYEAAARQAAAEYSQTILTAFREVEDALVTINLTRERIVLLTKRLDEAEMAKKLALNRYSKGLEKLLVFIETQRKMIQAENELAIARGSMLAAGADLYLALGGDWEIAELTENTQYED